MIVWDWYDGPREGVCQLHQPQCCFSFKLFAENSFTDDINDRLFQISEVPFETMEQILTILTELGQPMIPVWIPHWNFDSESKKQKVEQQILDLLIQATETDIIIGTRDMRHFWGCWIKV